MYVLILDDDPSIGRVLCRVAQNAGLSALAVTDPLAFQTCFHRDRPDAVLLDLQIGNNDGIGQLHFLASQQYANAVILISGFDRRVVAAAERLGRGLGLQILTAVAKPFRGDDVRTLFERLVACSSA